MPRIPFQRMLIELPVTDRQFADTVVKQKVVFQTLQHTQNAAGECAALITVRVDLYASAGGECGPALTGSGFQSYPVTLIADNSALVDMTPGPAFGAILARRSRLESDEQWQARIEAFPQNTLLQGDFFEYLRENVDVRIGDLIRQHIQQSDAAPSRFA